MIKNRKSWQQFVVSVVVITSSCLIVNCSKPEEVKAKTIPVPECSEFETNKDEAEKIFKAVRQRDLVAIKRLHLCNQISKKNITKKTPNGNISLLMIAYANKDEAMIHYLLERGLFEKNYSIHWNGLSEVDFGKSFFGEKHYLVQKRIFIDAEPFKSTAHPVLQGYFDGFQTDTIFGQPTATVAQKLSVPVKIRRMDKVLINEVEKEGFASEYCSLPNGYSNHIYTLEKFEYCVELAEKDILHLGTELGFAKTDPSWKESDRFFASYLVESMMKDVAKSIDEKIGSNNWDNYTKCGESWYFVPFFNRFLMTNNTDRRNFTTNKLINPTGWSLGLEKLARFVFRYPYFSKQYSHHLEQYLDKQTKIGSALREGVRGFYGNDYGFFGSDSLKSYWRNVIDLYKRLEIDRAVLLRQIKYSMAQHAELLVDNGVYSDSFSDLFKLDQKKIFRENHQICKATELATLYFIQFFQVHKVYGYAWASKIDLKCEPFHPASIEKEVFRMRDRLWNHLGKVKGDKEISSRHLTDFKNEPSRENQEYGEGLESLLSWEKSFKTFLSDTDFIWEHSELDYGLELIKQMQSIVNGAQDAKSQLKSFEDDLNQ